MQGVALVAAGLAGVAVLGSMQTGLVLGVGLAMGAHVEAGIGGAFAVIGITVLIILAFGSVGQLIALRSGEGGGPLPVLAHAGVDLHVLDVHAAQPHEEEWFKTIATANPISYLIEAPRSLFIEGWNEEALALGCGVAVVVLTVALTASVRILAEEGEPLRLRCARRRLKREAC